MISSLPGFVVVVGVVGVVVIVVVVVGVVVVVVDVVVVNLFSRTKKTLHAINVFLILHQQYGRWVSVQHTGIKTPTGNKWLSSSISKNQSLIYIDLCYPTFFSVVFYYPTVNFQRLS